MKLDPNIRCLFPVKYVALLELVEEDRFSQALHLCYERLSFSDDPFIRLLICLIYKGMGYYTLFQMELSQLLNSVKDISSICERLKTEEILEEVLESEPTKYGLPSHEAIPLREEILLEPSVMEFEAPEEALDKKAEILKDLATPSLAELYVEQGAIQEAINIYETYLKTNPHDQEALRRLKELKKPDPTEKLIKILEDWLTNLRASFSS